MFIQRYCVFASPTEQAQLARVARQGTTPQKIARRARLVWMLSHHESPSAVARTLHVSRMTVRLWARRFVTNGVPGVLREASRPGRRKQLSPAKVQAIVDATLTTRPPAGTHWSSRRLAKAQGVSDGTIRKIWRQHGLLSVSNLLSGRRWKLDHAPAVGDPTHMVEFGTGRRAFAREA